MKAEPPLLSRVRRFLDGLGPAPGGLVVAVSGGPDSVALLRSLLALRAGATPPLLVIAHLNHMLRGAESDADEEFIRRLHQELLASGVAGVELRCDRIDVRADAATHRSNLEGTARRLRYDWLAQVATAFGMRWIATGHTADDQAETVLHRLLRGTGLQGLRGIAARRPLSSGVEVIRPLLAVSRSEVLAYLDDQQQPFREDGSNRDRRVTRNRIRHELLPLLARDYNPAIGRLLVQLAEQAEESFRTFDTAARQLLAEAELPRAGQLLIFDRARLVQASRHLIREVLRLVWTREGWPLGDMSYAGWTRLAELAETDAGTVDLPGGIRARCRGRVVQVGPVC